MNEYSQVTQLVKKQRISSNSRESALSDTDKLFARFAQEFEEKICSSSFDTNRNIESTLDLGWIY